MFDDGVGALLVAKRPHSERLFLRIRGGAGSTQVDDRSLSAISYEPGDTYHEIRLSDSIAEVAGRGVKFALEPLVRRHFTSLDDRLKYMLLRLRPKWQRHVGYAVLNTAGSRILTLLAESLELEDSQVRYNSAAFDKYSNKSSVSLYYSLDALTRQRTLVRGDRLLFLAYGSGFMVRAPVMDAS